MNNELNIYFGDLNMVYLTKWGSHLYGTNTPESDLDFKGIFLPTREQILLGKIPKSLSFNSKTSAKGDKNTVGDIDCELYSFDYFVDLACQGQTVALEMLWAAKDHQNLYVKTDICDLLFRERDKFITKEMKAFIGFARSQAVKYSIKGDRLNTVNAVLEYLTKNKVYQPGYGKLGLLFDKFPKLPWVQFMTDDKGIEMVEICGRKLLGTVTVGYAIEVLEKVKAQYGERAKRAANMDGADFKALAHSFRVAWELEELYITGNITFPLLNRDLFMEIRNGEHPYDEKLADRLDELIARVEKMAEKSIFPRKVNRKMFDKIIIDIYGEIVNAG